MSSVHRINVQSCHGKTESKADLVSMETSGGKFNISKFSSTIDQPKSPGLLKI